MEILVQREEVIAEINSIKLTYLNDYTFDSINCA